jgi:hypothetical protein
MAVFSIVGGHLAQDRFQDIVILNDPLVGVPDNLFRIPPGLPAEVSLNFAAIGHKNP